MITARAARRRPPDTPQWPAASRGALPGATAVRGPFRPPTPPVSDARERLSAVWLREEDLASIARPLLEYGLKKPGEFPAPIKPPRPGRPAVASRHGSEAQDTKSASATTMRRRCALSPPHTTHPGDVAPCLRALSSDIMAAVQSSTRHRRVSCCRRVFCCASASLAAASLLP